MKASEVLRRYAAGERNFRRANLRGQSFKGQDLSGADFSEADIRSANFTNATLKGASFTNAVAGVQKRWLWAQQGYAFLMSALAGVFSAFPGLLIASLFFGTSPNQQDYFLHGIVSLVLIVVASIAVARQGFTAKALSTFSIAFSFILISVVASALPGAVTVTFSGAVNVAFASAGVFAIAVAVNVAGVFSLAFAFASAATVAFLFSIGSAGVFAGAFAFAFAILMLGLYCSHRAQREDKRFASIRFLGIVFGAIGGTSFSGADLTQVNFSGAVLKRTNFNPTKQRQTVLEWVCWYGAKALEDARVGNSILANSAVRELLVTRNGYKKSYVDANLRAANLDGVNLEQADLTWADLACATLRRANLNKAKLIESLVLDADFTGATLTGACLEAWNIDSHTNLDGVDCQYVYLLRNQKERRPSSGDFAPGEFTKLFQEVLSTVDLIFRNGVDWKAFVTAFKQVQVENEDTPLEIQSIENKGDGVVVVRVSAPPEANKEKIHSEFNQQYELALKALDAKYQAELQAKESEITIYREQSVNMWGVINSLATRPINVQAIAEAKAMNDSTDQSQMDISMSKFDLRNAQIAGGVAETVQGNQIGGTINNYGANLDEITRLITTLREQVQTFPSEQQGEALDVLDDLEADLQKPEPDSNKIGRRLKQLAAVATAVGTFAGGAATFSGDLNDFASNVIKLTETLGIPIELVQPEQVPQKS